MRLVFEPWHSLPMNRSLNPQKLTRSRGVRMFLKLKISFQNSKVNETNDRQEFILEVLLWKE